MSLSLKFSSVVAAIFFFVNIAKSQSEPIKGKLVYLSCANAVVEIENEKYFYLGQKDWQKNYTDTIYHNVFRVTNNCSFFKANIKQEQVFYFKIVTEPQYNNECVQCTMFESGPYARQNIEVVTIEK